MAFSGFLSLQLFFDKIDINAQQASQEKNLYAHYENSLSVLKAKNLKNVDINFKSLETKVVVLNFWASWCQPCLEEFPSLVKFTEKYKGRVSVFAINADLEDQLKNIKKTVKDYNLNFEIIADKESKILNQFLISKLPVSIIFHNGKVIEVSNGAKDFSSIETYENIDNLLKL